MTTNEIKKQMSKKGNTVGFANNGDNVCVKYSGKIKAWKVWSQKENYASLTNSTMKTFSDKQLAAEYAQTMIDDVKTQELKWWD